MPLKTIAQSWDEYSSKTMPKNASPVQIKETRQAFYCGYWLSMLDVQGAASELSEDDALKFIEDRNAEAEIFLKPKSGE